MGIQYYIADKIVNDKWATVGYRYWHGFKQEEDEEKDQRGASIGGDEIEGEIWEAWKKTYEITEDNGDIIIFVPPCNTSIL